MLSKGRYACSLVTSETIKWLSTILRSFGSRKVFSQEKIVEEINDSLIA